MKQPITQFSRFERIPYRERVRGKTVPKVWHKPGLSLKTRAYGWYNRLASRGRTYLSLANHSPTRVVSYFKKLKRPSWGWVVAAFLLGLLLARPTSRIIPEGVYNQPAPKPFKTISQTKLTEVDTADIIQITPVTPVVTYTPPPSVTVAGCGDNEYANYIYMHESGCRTGAENPGGCLGIGQACPGSKLLAACPGLDYACENDFFTGYANAVYGGWAGAYSFWLGHSWW